MLDSLTIRNFRLFEDLTIERLGRVNLIVGKNNSGKSCLLEVVELFLNGFHPLPIAEILNRRGMQDSITPENRSNQSPEEWHPVSNIFYNNDTEKTVTIRATVNSKKLTWTASIAYYRENSEGLLFQTEKPKIPSASLIRPFLESTCELPVEQDTQPYTFKFPVDISLAEVLSKKTTPHQKWAVYIPQNGLDASTIGALWNKSSLSDKRDTIKQFVSEAFPEIVDIDVVYQISSGYEIRARLQNDRIVNINSLGDGVRRYFGITLATVTSQGQTLVIDEFENGLHYSLHEPLWSNLFKLAATSNIQIFATTHSNDTVSAFESAWREHESAGAFHRLQQHPKTRKATVHTYELETLSGSLETDSEVR